jgi:hypothetical protein
MKITHTHTHTHVRTIMTSSQTNKNDSQTGRQKKNDRQITMANRQTKKE